MFCRANKSVIGFTKTIVSRWYDCRLLECRCFYLIVAWSWKHSWSVELSVSNTFYKINSLCIFTTCFPKWFPRFISSRSRSHYFFFYNFINIYFLTCLPACPKYNLWILSDLTPWLTNTTYNIICIRRWTRFLNNLWLSNILKPFRISITLWFIRIKLTFNRIMTI